MDSNFKDILDIYFDNRYFDVEKGTYEPLLKQLLKILYNPVFEEKYNKIFIFIFLHTFFNDNLECITDYFLNKYFLGISKKCFYNYIQQMITDFPQQSFEQINILFKSFNSLTNNFGILYEYKLPKLYLNFLKDDEIKDSKDSNDSNEIDEIYEKKIDIYYFETCLTNL